MSGEFDPKLKEAMKKIEDVMREYDIGGHISLVSPTHSEYMLCISPSWSCVQFEDEHVRFKATEEKYGSKQARNEAAELTVHLLLQIRDLGAQAFHFSEAIHEYLSKHMKITHVPYSKGGGTHE